MGRVLVRRAGKDDQETARSLMREARRVYLSWEATELHRLFASPAFWVAEQAGRLLGFLFCLYRHPAGAWLGGLGLAEGWPAERGLAHLLPPAVESLRREGVNYLACLGGERWLTEPLERDWGFRLCSRVITYRKEGWAIPDWGNREVQLRPAGPADLTEAGR